MFIVLLLPIFQLYQGSSTQEKNTYLSQVTDKHCRKHFPVLSSLMTYHRVCNKINTTDATSGAGTAHPSGAPEFTRF